jgi:hypothetical protein
LTGFSTLSFFPVVQFSLSFSTAYIPLEEFDAIKKYHLLDEPTLERLRQLARGKGVSLHQLQMKDPFVLIV